MLLKKYKDSIYHVQKKGSAVASKFSNNHQTRVENASVSKDLDKLIFQTPKS